jgi:hypothetical protein
VVAGDLAHAYEELSKKSNDYQEKQNAASRSNRYAQIAFRNGRLDAVTTRQGLQSELEGVRRRINYYNYTTSNYNTVNASGNARVQKDIHDSMVVGGSVHAPMANNGSTINFFNFLRLKGLLLAGGILAVIAALLPWITQQEVFSSLFYLKTNLGKNGYQTPGGIAVIVLGVLVVVISISSIPQIAQRGFALLFGGAVAVAGWVSFFLDTAELNGRANQLESWSASVNATAAAGYAQVYGSVNYPQSSLNIPDATQNIAPGLGIYLAMIAGILILLGAFTLKTEKDIR